MARKERIPNARLIDLKNVTGKQVFKISQKETKIGRSASNDFVILKDTVSSGHAFIEYSEGQFHLADLGSTNKTRLNGNPIKPHVVVPLNDGDEITIDVFKFIFLVEKKPGQFDPKAADAKPDGGSAPVSSDKKSRTPKSPKHIGKYKAIHLIGKGGFGSVWKAEDPKGRIVAIKFLNPDYLDNNRAVRKFFHEAIILSQLRHPNICAFVDFFPEDNNYAIVMDHVDGEELKTLFNQSKGPLPFKNAKKVAAQTLDAFQYASEKKILHRDIKPENIMIDTGGNAKIMDFGIAKMSSAATQNTAAFMVSTHYTPPERFDRSCDVDTRSDIYALGLVFYELFTGRYPFKAKSPSDVIFAQMNEIPDPPEKFVKIPHTMSQAILKALEKDPKDRFQDFFEFKEALFGRQLDATMEESAVRRSSMEKKDGAAHGAGASRDAKGRDDKKIVGCLEFPADVFSEGCAVLEQFIGKLKKLPAKGSKAAIIQDGPKMRLIVIPAGGKKTIFEKSIGKTAPKSKS